MKKIILFALITVMLLYSCGCTQESTEQDAELDQVISTPSDETADEPSSSETDQQKESKTQSTDFLYDTERSDDTYLYFPDQDYENWSFSEGVFDGPEIVTTYSELLEMVGADGVIVAGRAEGLRQGNRSIRNTRTTFRIEKVFFGQPLGETIQINEAYFPNYPAASEDEPFISYVTHWPTMLKDEELTLLFLRYRDQAKCYTPCYFQLPLPADYADYSEESMTELLDYYRNHKDMMKVVPPESSGMTTVQNPDGTETIEFYYGKPLIELEKTNAEMLELMDEHILVQAAAQLKIKIWPQNHIRYTGASIFLGDTGIKAEWRGAASAN